MRPRTTRSSGTSAGIADRTGARAARTDRGTLRSSTSPRAWSVGEDRGEQGGGAARRPDRVLRGDVPGHRRSVDERPLLAVLQRPAAGGVRDRHPAAVQVRAPHLRLGGLGRVAERVVGIDDETGEQVVAAREVAVDGTADHAQVARHRAQGQPRRALHVQVPPRGLDDLGRELGPGALAGGPGGGDGVGHSAIMPDARAVSMNESSALDNSRCTAP